MVKASWMKIPKPKKKNSMKKEKKLKEFATQSFKNRWVKEELKIKVNKTGMMKIFDGKYALFIISKFLILKNWFIWLFGYLIIYNYCNWIMKIASSLYVGNDYWAGGNFLEGTLILIQMGQCLKNDPRNSLHSMPTDNNWENFIFV